jgi:hypothetical protein
MEFLARWAAHVPERYEVRVRYAGAYATRRRVWWRRRGVALAASPPVAARRCEPAEEWPALRARRRRWAELLRRVFQVEVEVCPRCGGAARLLAFVTEPHVVRRILTHLERRGVEARAGPGGGWKGEPARVSGRGARPWWGRSVPRLARGWRGAPGGRRRGSGKATGGSPAGDRGAGGLDSGSSAAPGPA